MTEVKHAIEMTFCGANAAEVTKHIIEFATLHGSPLGNTETEALLKELRDRLAKNGQVVKIVPFANEETSSADHAVESSSTPTRGRGRPRKSVEEPTKPASDPIVEAEKIIAENTPSVPASTESGYSPATQAVVDGMKRAAEDMIAPTTIDEVKKALNEFAALFGQADARNVMQHAGGSPALKDVPAEKYGDVVAGLADKARELAAQKQAA